MKWHNWAVEKQPVKGFSNCSCVPLQRFIAPAQTDRSSSTSRLARSEILRCDLGLTMQNMAILQRFSRTFREKSALAKSINVFTIGGDLMACPQVKSGNGVNIFNATVADGRIKGKVISPCSYFSINEVRPSVTCGSNTLVKYVAAQQGSYLANSVKNPEGRHCFHTSRYNNFGLFAPLGVQQAVAQLPGYARSFSRGKKKGPRQIPDRNRNILDFKRRQLAEKYELRRNLHKALIRDPELPFAMRMKHRAKLSALPRNSSFTRARNRCVISGRPRGVYQRFRMSRIEFRLRALKGELIGVKKASW